MWFSNLTLEKKEESFYIFVYVLHNPLTLVFDSNERRNWINHLDIFKLPTLQLPATFQQNTGATAEV